MSSNIKILSMVILSFVFMHKSFALGKLKSLFGTKKTSNVIKKPSITKNQVHQALTSSTTAAFSKDDYFKDCISEDLTKRSEFISDKKNELGRWWQSVIATGDYLKSLNLEGEFGTQINVIYDSFKSIGNNLINTAKIACTAKLKEPNTFISKLNIDLEKIRENLKDIKGMQLRVYNSPAYEDALFILTVLGFSLEGSHTLLLKSLEKHNKH